MVIYIGCFGKRIIMSCFKIDVIDIIEIKRAMKEHSKQLYVSMLDMKDKKDKVLETHKLMKLTEKEI